MTKSFDIKPIWWIVGISTVILLFSSSLRHGLFQSSAFDLGIFDQAIYLISQGQPPITTIQGFHILGDHAAFIHYLLAVPYKLYPTVYWLFLIQAGALSCGVIPTYHLALQAGLKESQANAMAIVYLLYPLVYNANLFDFHPEVIAVPALLAAVLAARQRKVIWFGGLIILALSCKAVIALTVAAMGVWLWVFERRRLYGVIAIIVSTGWFLIATKLIIPAYSGAEAAAVGRYRYLGDSVLGIAQNLVLHPQLILTHIFSGDNLLYLVLLLLPIAWGLSQASLKPLLGAVPCIALNLLADYLPQKNLVLQYSLPAIPFLILAVIASLGAGKGLLQQQRGMMLWSLAAFLALAKFTLFTGLYLESIDNRQAMQEAIAQVDRHGSVYTTAQVTPHLSQRQRIEFTNTSAKAPDLNQFQSILLNVRHPGWMSTPEFAKGLVTQLQTNPAFQLQYQRDDVYLFVQKPSLSYLS